jgi:choline dehydrogenase-like flavoprotein
VSLTGSHFSVSSGRGGGPGMDDVSGHGRRRGVDRLRVLGAVARGLQG